MLTLLFRIVVEVFVGVSLAGVILALLIPALSLTDAVGQRDTWVMAAIVGVLISTVAFALFRPGSAIRRHARR
jgi:hypothetical protein